MQVVVEKDADAVSCTAAELFAECVRRGPSTLGLATGSSPVGTYRELADRYSRGELSFANCQAFLLDEYVGLPDGHPEVYSRVIRRDFVSLVDLPDDRVFALDGNAADLEAEALRYERAIADAGGIDVQLLGLGRNGHIGFNEPGSPLDSRTRTLRLSEETREDNARFFGPMDEVPRQVITQGLATIMRSGRAVLIVAGEVKAEAAAAVIEGPVTPQCPGSVLQHHPDAYVVLDRAAASRLTDRN